MEIKNAIIKGVKLDTSDKGMLTAWLHLDYGDNSSQAFGGNALYVPKSFSHHEMKGIAGHFIFRCMEVANVTEWQKLVGKTIRVKADNTKVYAIGNIINNDWFNPSEDFKGL